MIPILFDAEQTREQGFGTFGLGVLTDTISCTVTEELNGEFEMQMVYPISGIHYSKIALRSIILVGTTPRDSSGYNTQPFRVYSITKMGDGTATILARHLSYDLNGIPITSLFGSQGVGVTLSQLCTYLTTYAAFTNDFAYSTDYTGGQSFITEDLMSIRALIGQAIETFGVDVEFDGYDVNFLQNRGTDRGVKVRYGKNLIDLQQEQNLDEVYTGVYAYYKDGTGAVTVSTRVDVSGYTFSKLLPIDLSDEFDDEPSVASLTTAAQTYITENKIGIPEVSLSVSFVQLRNVSDGTITDDSIVRIGDEILVLFEKLGVNTTARINRIVYDALADEITEVGVGSAEKNISGTVATASEISAQNAKKTKMVEDIVGKYCLQYRKQITSGSLDDIDRQGHYYVVTANIGNVSGAPSGISVGYNVIHFNSAGSRAMQILYSNSASISKIFWRICTSGGSWTPWVAVENDTPTDISSGFSASGTSLCTASIAGAYYSHGYVTLRINTTSNASVASGSAMTGQVTFPTGYAPKIAVNSVSNYQARAFTGLLRTDGTFDFTNCGSSSMTSGHGVNMTFTYPCG